MTRQMSLSPFASAAQRSGEDKAARATSQKEGRAAAPANSRGTAA